MTQQLDEIPLTDCTLATFYAELMTLFAQAQGVAVDRMALFKRRHRQNEGFNHFHAALSKMAAKCNLRDRVGSIIREIFLIYIRDKENHRRICEQQLDPEETLRITIAYEMGLSRQRSIQEVQKPGSTTHTPNYHPKADDFDIEDEPHIKE